MKKKLYIILISLFLGIIFLCYQKKWIILNFPKMRKNNDLQVDNKNKIIKKNINLFFWQNSKWNKESIEIIWSGSIGQNCFVIVSNWLNILDEEKILDKRVSLQNAFVGINDQEIYLSFDRNIFNEENSTFEKLMLIEALLKTLRESDMQIKKVNFLIHHQEMRDNHLDFSHSWPIAGFNLS